MTKETEDVKGTYVQLAFEALQEVLTKHELECDPDLQRFYVLLMMTTQVTNEDVHDAWAVWQNSTNPTHKSIIRYAELTPEVQDMDTPYRIVINEAADIWFKEIHKSHGQTT